MIRILTIAFFLSMLATDSIVAGENVRTIVLSGEAAASAGSGTAYNGFLAPVINNRNEAAFIGFLAGGDVDASNGFGLYRSNASGQISLVARRGELTPDTDSPALFETLPLPAISDNSEIVFQGQLFGPEVIPGTATGIYRHHPTDGLSSIARTSRASISTSFDPNHDLSKTVVTGLNQPFMNSRGKVVFSGSVVEADSQELQDFVIFEVLPDDTLRLITRKDEAVPGFVQDIDFGISRAHMLNDQGQLLIGSGLLGPSPNPRDPRKRGLGRALLIQDGLDYRIIAQTGKQAPTNGASSQDPAVFIDYFSRPWMNNHGRVTFYAELEGEGTDETNYLGLYSGDSIDNLTLLARKGEVASADDPEAKFHNFSHPLINDQGETVFIGLLSGNNVDFANDSGVYRGSPEKGIELVAREGEPATLVGEDIKFGSFELPVTNDRGQIAFQSQLTGPGVDSGSDSALFAEDGSGQLRLIAREGDRINVSEDPLVFDVRTIQEIRFATDDRFRFAGQSGLNDLGQVAFTALFTDGSSGIFVSNLVAVPEPHTFVLLCLGTFAALSRSPRCNR